MKRIKILHCADIHFDTPFKELGKNLSDISKEELLEVFKRIINCVIEEKVEVLLIAGDMFDNLTVNKSTLFFIVEQLKRIKDTLVFISPGNHDPYNNKSFYEIIKWPENVYIFKDGIEKVEIKELNLNVWGAAFNHNYQKETLLKNVEVDPHKINLMVIHGEVSNKGGEYKYNPIFNDDIGNSKMDYIALGHTHEYSGIKREGNTYYAYSGCPQGRGFDEIGDKGIIIGTIYSGGVDLQFKSICKRKYYCSEIDVGHVNTYEEICNKIKQQFLNVDTQKNLFKVILKGNIKEHLIIKEDIIVNKLKEDFYYLKIVNKTAIDIDLDELSADFSVRGKFIKKMLKKLKNSSAEDKEIINLAIKIGLQALSEEEVKLDDN